MAHATLATILRRLQRGELSAPAAARLIRQSATCHLGYARLDTHRAVRRGFPETVFCQGKTLDQAATLLERLYRRHGRALGTRASRELFARVRADHPTAVYNEPGRVITLGAFPKPARGRIGIITAGTADIPVAEEAGAVAAARGQRVERAYDVGVAGLHRLLELLPRLRRCRVVIAVAGMDGALPSVVAGLLTVPVIAVPTSTGYGTAFGGIAPLLAMLNACAEGIGVVNIDNGYGAACLATMINDPKR